MARSSVVGGLGRQLRAVLFLPLRGLEALGRGLRRALLWLRAAYLTLRYVDEWGSFPAIRFHGALGLAIDKEPGARLVLHGRLHVRRWLGGRRPVTLSLGRDARMELLGPFSVGEDVRVRVSAGGRLVVHGAGAHGHSSVTASSRILVKRSVEIGPDVVLSWGTYVTDSDWHPIGGELGIEPVRIGAHVLVTPEAFILKGAQVGADSIVAPRAIVRRGTHPPGSLLAGDPAKPLRTRRGVSDWKF